MNWIKSSFCHWDQPQCVEITLRHGRFGPTVLMRDSKLGSASPVETFTRRQWRIFLREAHLRIPAWDNNFRIGDLAYTPAEWAVFLAGVQAGEFELGRLRERVAA